MKLEKVDGRYISGQQSTGTTRHPAWINPELISSIEGDDNHAVITMMNSDKFMIGMAAADLVDYLAAKPKEASAIAA